jgi:fructose-bisphosphate aldolase class 1
MNITVDFEHLVYVKNNGSDSQVVDAIVSLAGGQLSPESKQRIKAMQRAQRREYLGQLIYNLPKEVPFYNVSSKNA